jgi:hypothetical protein
MTSARDGWPGLWVFKDFGWLGPFKFEQISTFELFSKLFHVEHFRGAANLGRHNSGETKHESGSLAHLAFHPNFAFQFGDQRLRNC